MDHRVKPDPRSPVQPGSDGCGCVPILIVSVIVAALTFSLLDLGPLIRNILADETPAGPIVREREQPAPADNMPLPQPTGLARPVTGSIQGLITPDDYPPEAMDRAQQGVVTVRLSVGAHGRVTACSIERSSGYDSLDSASCRIMTSRGRFNPARDAAGQPTDSTFTQRIRWQLEE